MQESKILCGNYLKSFHSIWIQFSKLFRRVLVMNLILTLSRPFNSEGRESFSCDFAKKSNQPNNKQQQQQQQQQQKLVLACIDYRPISFKLGVMIGTNKALHFDISLTFIPGRSCMRNKFGAHFITNVSISLDEIQCVATTYWFVEAHAKVILDKGYAREVTLLT